MNARDYSNITDAANAAVDTLLRQLDSERTLRNTLQDTIKAMRRQRRLELQAERNLPGWRRKLLKWLRP